jgi:hypothetical protein
MISHLKAWTWATGGGLECVDFSDLKARHVFLLVRVVFTVLQVQVGKLWAREVYLSVAWTVGCVGR